MTHHHFPGHHMQLGSWWKIGKCLISRHKYSNNELTPSSHISSCHHDDANRYVECSRSQHPRQQLCRVHFPSPCTQPPSGFWGSYVVATLIENVILLFEISFQLYIYIEIQLEIVKTKNRAFLSHLVYDQLQITEKLNYYTQVRRQVWK